jgi:hypothetical protein
MIFVFRVFVLKKRRQERWRCVRSSDGPATAGIFLELLNFITLLAQKFKDKNPLAFLAEIS